MDIQRKAFQEWYIANHHDGDIHPNQQLLEWSEKGGFYFASSVEDLWEAWQQAQKVAVPEPTKEVICAIENTVEDQLIASGITSDPFRLDGEKIFSAMIEAGEKMISGKEALIALANGEEVQGNIGSEWVDITVDQKLSIKSFTTETNDYGCAVKFRIKPQTITINGIEVPKPFEPKEDCIVYILDDSKTSGYRSYSYEFDGDSDSNFFGLWEREEEIKQVVEALRQVFGGV